MATLTVRPARPDEAEALSALNKRSKAHWGYDAAFMALSDTSLTVTPALIATGRVLVAERGGALAGMASLDPLGNGVFDLLHMFVEPDAIGTGAGRALFDAICAMARTLGGSRLSIMADPNAAGFYERLGAQPAGEAPSDAVPGRMLPMLDFDL